ncbi:MAG: VOC family protein [Thermoplasmata archaeon]|nr:VOC family protein [Thermoplasmata archaeon]
MNGRVVHFELPADDVKRATGFYQKTFDWKIQPMPEMEYTMLGTSPSDAQGIPTEPGAINGGMGKRGRMLKVPVVTLMVDSIDAAAKLIVKNGGKMVRAKEAIGPMGFTAYFSDTEGNVVGLFQPPAE